MRSHAAAVALLVAFAVIEARTSHPLLPVRVLRSRDRSGAYLIALCVGTAMFGMFFFLTLFLQDVWGYSALRSGLAYLPIMATVMAMSAVAAQLVPSVGARPLLIPRVGGDYPAHLGGRTRHAPGEARGPGRHQPDGSAFRLNGPSDRLNGPSG